MKLKFYYTLFVTGFFLIVSCKPQSQPIETSTSTSSVNSSLNNLVDKSSQEFNANKEDCNKVPTPKPINEPIEIGKPTDSGCKLK